MKVLIIYDSMYGNTEKIAKAIAGAFISSDKAKILRTSEAPSWDLKSINLLIVGSPTHGGKPTPDLQRFLDQIPADALKDISIASFDTRFLEKDQGFALRLLMRTIGYAASRIADSLKSKGGKIVVPPEGFIVKAKEGPLAQGELERAKTWVKQILSQINKT